MDNREREMLVSFLFEVEDLLRKIIDWREILFREDFRGPLVRAWEEVGSRFEPLRDQVRFGDFDKELDQAGLSGAQLELKLAGYTHALELFRKEGSIKRLKKLLDWINSILKSIVSAIPGGDWLVELKEAIEKEIEGSD